MDTLYRCCAGLDVRKETVAASVRRVDPAGRVGKEVRTFGTTTGELLRLLDWLTDQRVEAAAMESTGVFWKPIWNILEGSVQLILVSHSKKTYLSSQYRRLAGRRGKKRAIIALAHTMLVMMYHMLRDGAEYQELGHDYLDKLQPQRLTAYLVKRLESLGHKVILADQAA